MKKLFLIGHGRKAIKVEIDEIKTEEAKLIKLPPKPKLFPVSCQWIMIILHGTQDERKTVQ